MTREDYIRSLAYHEAGHVVLALHFGRRIGTLTIDRDHHKGGAAISDPSAEPEDQVRQALIALAGGSAQEKFLPGSGTCEFAFVGGASFTDVAQAHEYLASAYGEKVDSDKLYYECTERVDALLDHPKLWRAVVGVAEALYQNGSLSPEDVARIVETA